MNATFVECSLLIETVEFRMILIRRCLCQWMGRETIERVRLSSLENAIKNKSISKSQKTNVMLVSDLLNILVYFS